jgi:transposase
MERHQTNKPRGIPRVDDRRVLIDIFWALRSGAPWRDRLEIYGPRTTCYNRFVRWPPAGVWDQIVEALAAAHDATVLMIDTSVVRVHQHGACIAGNSKQDMGRSRGGLTSKVHAVCFGLSPGEAHDNRLCQVLLACAHEQCYWRTVATMPTGSESSSTSKVRGPTYPRR